MPAKTKYTVEELKEEITELKLSDIRKDITSLKQEFGEKLDKLIGHVEKTNGSVAKVTEQSYRLEQLQSIHREEDAKHWSRLEKIDEETKVIRWVSKKPKIILILSLALLYSMAVPEIRALFADLIKTIF